MDKNIAEEIIKLSQNENPFGPSPMALEAVAQHSESMNRYPEPHSQKLEAELASHVGVEPENVFICHSIMYTFLVPAPIIHCYFPAKVS